MLRLGRTKLQRAFSLASRQAVVLSGNYRNNNWRYGKESKESGHNSRKAPLFAAAVSAIGISAQADNDRPDLSMIYAPGSNSGPIKPIDSSEKVGFMERLLDRVAFIFRLCTLFGKFAPLFMIYPVVHILPLPEFCERAYWKLVVWAFESSGPMFIKLGQWMSTRMDLFPLFFCQNLKKLHSTNEAHDMRHTRRAIQEAFGSPLSDIFVHFDEDPIGSGCIGQVYKAQMYTLPNRKVNGNDQKELIDVAVKILHPNIKKIISRDVRILNLFTWLYDTLVPRSISVWIDMQESMAQFIDLLETQLDLSQEARNLDRFRKNFKNISEVEFPQPLWPYVCETLLVETFEEGKSIAHYIEQSGQPELNARLAEKGMNMLMEMTLSHNFVHADLHPGNILVRESTNPQDPLDATLVILDAGIVVELNRTDRENFEDLFFAVVNNDGKACAKMMFERARFQRCTTVDEFMKDMDRIVSSNNKLALNDVDIGAVLLEVTLLSCKHKVKLETRFVTLMIAIMLLEGIGRSLDPHTNILSVPFILERNATRQVLRQKGFHYVVARYWEAVTVARAFMNRLLEDEHQSIEVSAFKARVDYETSVEHPKQNKNEEP